MERMVPTQKAIPLSAQLPGGLEALYPQFVPEPADDSDEGDERWA